MEGEWEEEGGGTMEQPRASRDRTVSCAESLEGGREGGRERWREGEMEGGRKGGRERWREGEKKGGREGMLA